MSTNASGSGSTAQDTKKKNKIEEELEALKAEKVDGMIDPIYLNGQFHSHLLYLTNWQANAISNNIPSVKRMVEIFHGKNNKPRFIIHLVQSWGFYRSTKLMHEDHFNKGMSIGIEHNTPPFKDDDDYMEMHKTHARLNHFMCEVILPLAERTNALIICNAVADECILTETLINVLRMNASRWDGGPMPFTVVKIMNQVDCLYKKRTRVNGNELMYMKDFEEDGDNKDKNFVDWMKFMKQSKSWKRRHEDVLKKHYENHLKDRDKKDWWKGHDLDWSLGNIIVIEGLDKCEDDTLEKNYGPANLFLTRILDTYGHIPTLAIKTGATPRDREKLKPDAIDLMGYPYLVNRVNSETHVLCLDVRKRKPELPVDVLPSIDKIYTDDDMKSFFGEDPKKETLDCCALSFLGKTMKTKEDKEGGIIYHDDDDDNDKKLNVEEKSSGWSKSKDSNHSDDDETSVEEKNWMRNLSPKYRTRSLRRTTSVILEPVEPGEEEVAATDRSLKKRISTSLGLEMPNNNDNNKKKKRQISLKQLVQKYRDKGDHKEYSERKDRCLHYAYAFTRYFRDQCCGKEKFDSRIPYCMATNIQQLLKSHLFHCVNIWESEKDLEAYIDERILFKYHRPQSIVPFEGLKLLESAWEYVDKTSTDADGYRKLCIALFLAQLILGVLITILTVAALRYEKGSEETDDIYNKVYKDVTLVTTLLLTAIVSIDSLLTPKLMWRQLRLASVELESLIWKYRAGVGKFAPGLDTSRDAEDNFDNAFTRWKENLLNTLNNVGGTMIPQNIKHLSTSALPACFTGCKRREWTSSENVDLYSDNHYSYVLSKDYLKWRYEKLLEIYQERLPKRVWSQQKWQLFIIVLGIGIAFLTETDIYLRPELILILTAIAGALNSWSGFVDLQGDAQLYPPAINALRNKAMEWEKRIKHQQQDLELFEDLVMTIENVALNVVESWSNTLSENNTQINNFDVLKGIKPNQSKAKSSNDLESIV